MVQRLIVPVDGSASSWRAVDTAVSLARRCDASVEVVEVVFAPSDRDAATDRMTEALEGRPDPGVPIESRVEVTEGTVAGVIDAMLERSPGATVVMASHGRGRSAAFLGSIAENIVRETFGPVLVVGPEAAPSDFSGPLVVTVDGSPESEMALPLAAAWGIELRVVPWIVHVSDPDVVHPSDVADTAYTARLARKLAQQSHHRVEFDELHDHHPGDAVAAFVGQIGASLVVASSHGRSGLSRLAVGSTTATFIRNAPCPVLVVRPVHESKTNIS